MVVTVVDESCLFLENESCCEWGIHPTVWQWIDLPK